MGLKHRLEGGGVHLAHLPHEYDMHMIETAPFTTTVTSFHVHHCVRSCLTTTRREWWTTDVVVIYEGVPGVIHWYGGPFPHVRDGRILWRISSSSCAVGGPRPAMYIDVAMYRGQPRPTVYIDVAMYRARGEHR